MIRTLLIATVLAAAAVSPASAVPLLGDFECLSDLGGPDTYHGTLRIEEPTEFSFLSDAAMPGETFPLDISNPEAVVFTDDFAEQISAGASMVSARELVGEFSYQATIRTKKGDEVVVTCLYVY